LACQSRGPYLGSAGLSTCQLREGWGVLPYLGLSLQHDGPSPSSFSRMVRRRRPSAGWSVVVVLQQDGPSPPSFAFASAAMRVERRGAGVAATSPSPAPVLLCESNVEVPVLLLLRRHQPSALVLLLRLEPTERCCFSPLRQTIVTSQRDAKLSQTSS
jgi:hypothetical protein